MGKGLRPADIPSTTLALLQAGRSETKNFMEQIALNIELLFGHVFPHEAGRVEGANDLKFIARMQAAGQAVADLGPAEVERARRSGSDTVRAWAALAIGSQPRASFKEQLDELVDLVSDDHFAVREWVWLAVRHQVVADPVLAVGLLGALAENRDERVRRFAIELTRPRGVWSQHVPLLKRSPEIGVSLLITTHNDPSSYVRRSLGNWLNDASKTRPGWVLELCGSWRGPYWTYEREVCSRALRSIRRASAGLPSPRALTMAAPGIDRAPSA